MKKLTRREGIAVGIVLVATFGVLFFGEKIFQFATQSAPVSNSSAPTTTANATASAGEVFPDGLRVEYTQPGTGAAVKAGDTVSVNYTGALSDGRQFDSSYKRGKPISFTVGAGQLIKGFDEGVIGMKVGEKRMLTIPPDLGYGSNAIGPIPANSALVFEVELVSIGN